MPVEYTTSKLISCPHAFSTRLGGVSEGVYESLNLGLNRGDEPERVMENWRIFGKACGIPTERLVYGKQVHEANVRIVGREDLHALDDPRTWEPADGYVTKEAHVPLVIFTADCTPLLMHDPVAGVIAAVHCGWRSTVADIEGEAVNKMLSLGSHAADIRAAIGPCIGPCCFETGAEVPAALRDLLGADAERFIRPKQEKFMVDLGGAVLQRLRQLGLTEDHIENAGECTMCAPQRYWSHRYTKGVRGSQANIIML